MPTPPPAHRATITHYLVIDPDAGQPRSGHSMWYICLFPYLRACVLCVVCVCVCKSEGIVCRRLNEFIST